MNCNRFKLSVFLLTLLLIFSLFSNQIDADEYIEDADLDGDEHYEDHEYDEMEDNEYHKPLVEEERRLEYENLGYTYPIPDEQYIPNTTGWINLMKNRLQQIQSLPDASSRYEGYMQTMTTAFIVPNFTEHGFGLARCMDEELMNELRSVIHDGIETADEEPRDAAIPGPNAPLLINTHFELTQRVLYELQHYAETWANMELVPVTAYGFRIYRNESQLHMHIDRPQTHIISFILHIASSADATPWPLVIEDLHGNTHEVTLTSGDMLFYESSKLLHGRPGPLNGSWYSSIFVHYFPKHVGWEHRNLELETHYAVPPIWNVDQPNILVSTVADPSTLPRIEMLETCMLEPECPNEWCHSNGNKTKRWGGPAQDYFYHTPTGEMIPFHPVKYGTSQENESLNDGTLNSSEEL